MLSNFVRREFLRRILCGTLALIMSGAIGRGAFAQQAQPPRNPLPPQPIRIQPIQHLAQRPLNIVTLGDSIMWGQGLPEQLKFRTLVANWLQVSGRHVDFGAGGLSHEDQPPGHGVQDFRVAHAGAVLLPLVEQPGEARIQLSPTLGEYLLEEVLGAHIQEHLRVEAHAQKFSCTVVAVTTTSIGCRVATCGPCADNGGADAARAATLPAPAKPRPAAPAIPR